MGARTRGLLVVVAAGLALALVVALGLDEKRAEEPRALSPATGEADAETLELAASTKPVAREAAFEVESVSAAEATAPSAPAAPPDVIEPDAATVELRGRVVDLDGEPHAGAIVVWGDARAVELARTDPSGAFRVEVPPVERRRELTLADARLAVLRTSQVVPADAEREHVLVAEPAVDLAGRVVDEDGAPLARAMVRVGAPQEAFAGFPYMLETTRVGTYSALTEEGGSFRFERVPGDARVAIDAMLGGYRKATRAMPEAGAADVLIVLEPVAETPEAPQVTGVVLHADRTAAGGATVRLGEAEDRTDELGRFSLPCAAHSSEPLVAALAGFQPAVRPAFAAPYANTRTVPPPVELVLGPEALAIDGRVLDASDEPCAGWVVTLVDGTSLRWGRTPPDFAEDLARGDASEVLTRADGSFRIEGLSARAYTLRAYDRTTLAHVISEPIEAGTRVVLRVPAGHLLERVTGRVVSRERLPVEGARVTVGLLTAENGGAKMWENGASATSDASGEFVLEGVPSTDVFLSVEGEVVMPTRVDVDLTLPGEVVLEAPRRCRLRVEDGTPEPADAAWLLDASGEALAIYHIKANGHWTSVETRLTDGKSLPLAVSEDARTLVFAKDGVEVARQPLSLRADEVAVLRR